jgi:hypothetical protein
LELVDGIQARLCAFSSVRGSGSPVGSKPGNCYAATAAALSLRRMLNHRMML